MARSRPVGIKHYFIINGKRFEDMEAIAVAYKVKNYIVHTWLRTTKVTPDNFIIRQCNEPM